MKYILFIGDGMADLPVTELGGKTPLEVSVKPNIDALANSAEFGTVKTCPDGLAPGSDVAIMTIFGCGAAQYYFGRAPLEAADQGVAVPDGAMAFRCNMASVADGRMKSHSAGGIDGVGARKLAEDLAEDTAFSAAMKKYGVSLYPTDSYRHIAILNNPDLTADGSALVLRPPHDNIGKALDEILPRGGKAAPALSELIELSRTFLSKHPINVARQSRGLLPANCLWFWAKGTAANLPSFRDRYNKTGAVISAVPLVRGIGRLQGLDIILVEGATGELETNYAGKADAVVDALKTRDFAAVHVEAPDECTHNFDLPGKIKAIENIDRLVVKPVLDALKGEHIRALILSDHYTLTKDGSHDATPVPYAIYDSALPNGGSVKFTESNAAGGSYIPDGTELMERLFSK
ncbi:MAG: 2,3-bisphosphoglycerate-independent phosphoglycerate mutase [Oscillospiraceae bacterium]|nr:2,3-bisphosphoglycerate-independent phosphoglycerate mutase [Oscillospiraceae bacterium]